MVFGIIDDDTKPLHPEGNALLYMSPDDLEYTLVGYGVLLLEDSPKKHAQEIAEVDAVLSSIDKALRRKS